MWRYRCKNQLITLAVAFVSGIVLAGFVAGDPEFTSVMTQIAPELLPMIESQPWLIWLSGGLVGAGIVNVFLLAQLASTQFGISPLLVLLVVMLVPDWLMPFGILALPFTLVLSIYGIWSLHAETTGALNRKNIRNIQELIRMYTIHHPLDEAYKEMAVTARRNIMKASLVYGLGVVAVFCVIIFMSNAMVSLLVIFVYMFAFTYLSRYRTSCFMPITKLLYEDCDPEACMSALIYFGQHGRKVRLANPALMAECMIYLNDPSLAQDFLVMMQRNSPAAVMRYWSLMAYTYYMLSDASGLERCKEMVSAVKPGYGAMGVMMKNEDLAAIDNRIRLMNGDFNACKAYYLDRLKKAPYPLIQAECDYYIALISFVQEDYSLADLYFRKVEHIGGKVSFMQKAAGYLEKIDGMHIDTEKELTYTAAVYERSGSSEPQA